MRAQEKQNCEKGYNLHGENKCIARKAKELDKQIDMENPNYLAATFDLQKVLQVAKSDGLVYYKLKLKTYNFTILNLGTNYETSYMWHEVKKALQKQEAVFFLLMRM